VANSREHTDKSPVVEEATHICSRDLNSNNDGVCMWV
jgi:hypothetical protein